RTAAVAMGVVEGRRARRLPPAAIAPPSYPYRRPCATARAASARRSDVSRDLYIGREGVENRLPHWRRKPLRGAGPLPANDASAGFGARDSRRSYEGIHGRDLRRSYGGFRELRAYAGSSGI